MKNSTAYVAVPTSGDDVSKAESNQANNVSVVSSTPKPNVVRIACYVILGFILLGLIFDEGDHHSYEQNPDYYSYNRMRGGPSHHHGHHGHHNRQSHHHSRDHDHGWWHLIKERWGVPHGHHAPTKLPGGGRDWLLDVTEGLVVAKHNPSLVLGVDSTSPLVLVPKGSANQLTFGPPPSDETESKPLVSEQAGGVIVQDKIKLPGILVRMAGLNVDGPDTMYTTADVATVSYKDNFVVLNDKMVLDVAFWNIVEGSHVNFVSDAWCSKRTFVHGGGRDWIWNEEDGTIATKLNPNLVLGQSLPSMVLVSREDDEHKLVLDSSIVMDLASGKSVPMTLDGSGVVTERFDEAKDFGPWHFIESAVDSDSSSFKPITIRYDGNYVFVHDDEKLVLDVAFWKMEPGVVVNFVGGDDDGKRNEEAEAANNSFVRGGSSSSSED